MLTAIRFSVSVGKEAPAPCSAATCLASLGNKALCHSTPPADLQLPQGLLSPPGDHHCRRFLLLLSKPLNKLEKQSPCGAALNTAGFTPGSAPIPSCAAKVCPRSPSTQRPGSCPQGILPLHTHCLFFPQAANGVAGKSADLLLFLKWLYNCPLCPLCGLLNL